MVQALDPVGPAQAVAPNSDDLSAIVVVANRVPAPLASVGNDVTVLDQPAIEASQAVVISDLLSFTPGVGIVRNGGVGQPTSVFIRGAESDQTVVLIDGVLMTDPSAPGGDFNIENLLTSDIARIEILRGSQSTLYGSQAMGGVLNVTSQEPTQPLEGGLRAEGGSHNTGYLSAHIGGLDDALTWRLAGHWYGTSGIPCFDQRFGGMRDCASQIGGGSGELRYQIAPAVAVDARGYYSQARTDFDGYDTPPTFTFGDDSEYQRNSQLFGYLALLVGAPDARVKNRLAFDYTSTETHDLDPAAPVNLGAPSTLTYLGIGHVERTEYQGNADLGHWQATFGAQDERSTIDSDSPQYQPAPQRSEDRIDSGYFQFKGEPLAGLTLTAGDRYDRHSIFGGHSTSQLAAAWQIETATVLRASFGQGFKAPSLYQLYSNYGNLDLRPELSRSWDAGIEQHVAEGRLVLLATYFDWRSRDLIEFFDCLSAKSAPLCTVDPFGFYANIARARGHGAEFQATLSPSTAWTIALNYTLTETEDDSPGSPTYGQPLRNRPKNTGNASVGYRFGVPLTVRLESSYAGPTIDEVSSAHLGGYTLFNLKLAYELSASLTLEARVENLTNHWYETIYEYGTYGRSAYAGVRARF
jgi:vitamin B12 transporter